MINKSLTFHQDFREHCSYWENLHNLITMLKTYGKNPEEKCKLYCSAGKRRVIILGGGGHWAVVIDCRKNTN